MIILLGSTGYVGRVIADRLTTAQIPHVTPSRGQLDYYDPSQVSDLLRRSGATFLINAAGYTGKPNVDACEVHRTDCLNGNAVLPGVLADACQDAGIRWGHVSSGCIYTGRRPDGGGFRESDPPNFCFRTNNCSWYSGCKALGEEILADRSDVYVWRLRIPFDHRDGGRNYLSKLQRYDTLLEAENSVSHLGDFANAVIRCIDGSIPTGIYNLTNPGSVRTSEVVEIIKRHLPFDRDVRYFADEDEFMQVAAATPRSNCVLDTTKAAGAGLAMRPVTEAIVDALENWRSEDRKSQSRSAAAR